MVVPGEHYQMGGLGRFFWGDHYRDAWSTPIEVAVLNLRSFAGGLTPLRRGGGQQTKSLRLLGANGKTYSFRSIDKDPSAALPPVLRTTLAADVLQDQISSQHPTGALVCCALLEAAGVLHAQPQLVVMPDDPHLGEFQEEFAGMLGMIEERPDENDDSLAAFAGAERVIGSEELLNKVSESPIDRVNAKALLKARLIDLYVGDWDRHLDQWRWARFSADSATGWYPIPRDRDQVFSRMDGFFPGIAQFRVPQLVGFSDEYTSIFSLHWNARDLDRRFLSGLEKPTWDSVVADIVTAFADDVIERAVLRLPTEFYALDGTWLEQALKRRRAGLAGAANEFYRLLADQVEIFGTDASEDIRIEESSDGQVHISLTERREGSAPYFTRRFDPSETSEIRLRLHGGDDHVTVSGSRRLAMTIRVVGGGGDDTYQFNSPTRGVQIYDARGSNRIDGAAPSGMSVDGKAYRRGRSRAPRYWGTMTMPTGRMWYSTDFGLLVGGGISLHSYGFRKDPYATRSRIYAAGSTNGRYDISIDHDIRTENSPLHTVLKLRATSFDVAYFYGFGNEAPELPGSDFHSVQRGLFVFEPALAVSSGNSLDVSFGPTLRYSKTWENEGKYITTIPDLYGIGAFGEIGLAIEARLDTRRDMSLEEVEQLEDLAGFGLLVDGSLFPTAWDVESTYGQLRAVATAYVPAAVLPHTVLAFRAGGETILGEHPWFDAAHLGGLESLRGWRAQRFAGDGTVFGSAELRTYLTDFNLIMPQLFGVCGSVDAGRVWVDGESPGDWHVGYGGGIWLGFLGSRNLFSASYFQGDGSSGFYVDWGFAF
jgi:hypothetical protein